MIFVWIINAIRKVVFLFRIPKPEELAIADKNEKCPVCGWRDGRMRCVVKTKIGPRTPRQLPTAEALVLRQHRCNQCGAGWHHQPLLKDVDSSKVLPSPARSALEQKEDRVAFMEADETVPST